MCLFKRMEVNEGKGKKGESEGADRAMGSELHRGKLELPPQKCPSGDLNPDDLAVTRP